MPNIHISEMLIEANKKISDIINKMERDEHSHDHIKRSINDLNTIIRSLDHIVEELQRKLG